MKTNTDSSLIRAGKKMNKLAEQMQEIYGALLESDNPKAQKIAEIFNANGFDLWCDFKEIAEDVIKDDSEENT